MPAKSPPHSPAAATLASVVGRQVRNRRKALGVTIIAAAEAAGMSRVTWHRIERGGLSVTLGAYLSALTVLDLTLSVGEPKENKPFPDHDKKEGWLPLEIRLAEFPQLRQLAWQVRGIEALTPREAWNFYQRNWRHVDTEALEPTEQHLINALKEVFGDDADV